MSDSEMSPASNASDVHRQVRRLRHQYTTQNDGGGRNGLCRVNVGDLLDLIKHYEEINMKHQDELMKFDPANGSEKPYPSCAKQWRKWHGESTAWLFNPWSGERRSAGDVGSDVVGLLIVPIDNGACAVDSNDYVAVLTEDMVSHLVSRFLCWRLPDDFSPDCGIAFTPPPEGSPEHFWPVGTHLLNADQAKAMILHMLGDDA